MNKTQILISTLLLLGFAATLAIGRAVAQANLASQSSPQNAPFTWKRVVHLHDGRTFISDGAIALDVESVKPADRPKPGLPEASSNIIEGYLNAQLPDECALSKLTRRGEAYAAPNGVTLNPTYIEYLRRTLPESRVRLRMKGLTEPVVILLDGKPIGLLMPMRSVNP